ncbi:MAG: hypothetical protein Q8M53_03405 [Burkholderiales bacterium]|nr:hypothetical protein [Burkholderiales bacterium]
MAWFRKAAKAAPPVAVDGIAPAPLPLPLDEKAFRRHFDALLAGAAEDGGIEAYLAALGAKVSVFAILRERARAASPALDQLEPALELAFTARRHLHPALEVLGTEAGLLVRDLWFGALPPDRRLQQFVDAMPGAGSSDRAGIKAAAKLRRAAWDFAAELLHYGDPLRYPLMTRWVWDQATQSGALRELVRGSDSIRELPFGNDPGLFEGARCWLAEQLAAQGIYRDEELWVDLVQAQAYLGYFRSMTEGSLGADFGRGVPPQEQLKRMLGIDAAPGDRSDRVKKRQAATHTEVH